MTNNYFRIRTNITKDQVVRTKLTQDIDFLEILSLKISQEDAYKLHVSNYGVIVGRVLANDAFGIPNAKVSVFIPLDDDDKKRSEIASLYPYTTSQTKDSENRRYNLLPDDSNDICYRVVGSFPNKRLVLDNNTEIEIFEKYWKYTTVTNKSGDYMIFGVPTGNQEVHVDVDLSDIGVLSQKPRDFMYKGYSITQFDNSSQFKESTNLDNLSQLLSQNSAVHVYPFWGDTDVEEVAISRCDLQVQYKFEPTCVFFGSIVSDNFSNSIGDKCNPSKHAGFNRKLVAGEGTIEMIRKTQEGLIEEYQIQGNRLIDGNGVWCYQIPMNLDYVGTDEFGNIVPTDDPKKGIPTRTSVRFRVSMQETSSEGISRHRAKYLIPNVHEIANENGVKISNPNKYEQCYEFGSATPDEFFRDLYWNKVYSVKNYIPRIQLGSTKSTQKYSAIRTTNESGNLNPFPFNHGRFRLVFSYRLLCMIFTIVLLIICALNWLVSLLASICLPLGFTKLCPFKWVCGSTFCISVTGGLAEDSDDNIEYFPCCNTKSCMKCREPGCKRETSYEEIMNKVQQSLAQEYDTVNLDFYNDWINGCLYFPLWFWKKTKKKKFLFGLFSKKAVNRYCNCDSNYKKLRITEGCSLHFNNDYDVTDNDKGKKYHEMFPDAPINIGHGIIKEVENKNGLKVYYYAPGVPRTNDYKDTTEETVDYARLYSTDIILLGSLNDCDLDNLPRPFLNIPSTTANIPFISTLKDSATDSENDDNEKGIVEITGMDWLSDINNGLFMDLSCTEVKTKPKTCINIARMCELGVTLDTRYYDAISDGNVLKYDNERPADGLITRYELVDNETRAMFASLNHNGLVEKVRNLNTGYDTYKLVYNYPTDFDGHLKTFAPAYTKKFKVKTYDNKNAPYIDYIFGIRGDSTLKHFYMDGNSKQMPLFNNSFYFYFGLNEGNTAIDKFNNLFYSECFKNTKYPFTMTYSTTSAKWCKKYDNVNNKLPIGNTNVKELETDYATIDVTLKNIKMPYSYTLYDEYNEPIVSEDNVYTPILKFGYNIENGEYSNDKYGALKKISDSSVVSYEDGKYVYLLDNGNYNLKVVDYNGNAITQLITILQSGIIANISVIGLGDKFYDGTSTENDFCNEFKNYGEIIINSISIDGKNYTITECNGKNDTEFELICVYGDNTSNVLLKIEHLDESSEDFDELSFSACTCNGNGGILQYEVKNDGLHFNVWIPGDYKITVTQYCNGQLNDNTSSDTVNVPNGKPFLTYVGETPLRFVVGKNTSIKDGSYNTNFYSPTAVTSVQNMKGWFNLHDENVYKFESTNNVKGIEVWKDFIDADYVDDGNGGYEDVTLSTKMEILAYKFERLMEMSNMFYIFSDDDKTISFIANGGKAPILYRGSYPKYSDFSFETNEVDNKVSTYVYDSDAFVTCPSAAGNIVGYNYSRYDSELNIMNRIDTNNSPRFNTLFSDDTHLGNYFAAYTQNAGCSFTSSGWTKDNTIVYLSDPYKSDPHVLDVEPGENEIIDSSFPTYVIGNGANNSYFRGVTIDRRIDYSYFIIMPYNENNGISLGTSNWRNGRFTGYQINGLALAYDDEKNYVGVGESGNTYEYYIQSLPTEENSSDQYKWFGNGATYGNRSKIVHTKDLAQENKRRLYSHTLRCGKTYDINDRFWAQDEKDVEANYIDGITFIGNVTSTTNRFDESNYPTKRKIDMINFPSANKYTYSAVNCKYNLQLDFVNNGGSEFSYSAIVQEGDETTFDINGNNSVQLDNNDLATSASNSMGNVTFTRDGNIFTSSKIDITFKIPDDTTNSTHNNFVYLPFYNKFNYSDNPYTKIKEDDFTLDNEFSPFIMNLLTKLGGTQIVDTDSIIPTSSDFWSQVEETNDLIPNDVFGMGIKRFALTTSKAPLYCDNSLMKSVNFTLKKEVTNDFVSVFYFRRYINNLMDNLSKDIMTLNIGTLIDTRKIEMAVVTEIDDSMTGSGSVTVPTVGESGETGSTTEDVTTSIERQVTTFNITIPDASATEFNQGFTDPSRISAAIKCENKVASDSTVTVDGNILSIRLVWGSALSGVLLDAFPKPCELFIKMPNNLIFKFDFSLNSSGYA